jgi:DNA topoisomerase-1
VPEKARLYSTKAKNAQEAHEAIRPTGFERAPDRSKKYLDADQLKLYDLIWKRATASQMASAEIERTTVEITASKATARQPALRATGSVIKFDGFIAAYTDAKDDGDSRTGRDDDARACPRCRQGSPGREKIEPPSTSPSRRRAIRKPR